MSGNFSHIIPGTIWPSQFKTIIYPCVYGDSYLASVTVHNKITVTLDCNFEMME